MLQSLSHGTNLCVQLFFALNSGYLMWCQNLGFLKLGFDSKLWFLEMGFMMLFDVFYFGLIRLMFCRLMSFVDWSEYIEEFSLKNIHCFSRVLASSST